VEACSRRRFGDRPAQDAVYAERTSSSGLPEKRRRGIATQLTHAAEEEARARGWNSISLSVSQEGNAAARLLYTKLGYIDAAADPVRVTGPIMLRGRPFDVDDTLVYLTKHL
jgi:GNAT superfamily N-acetyltransferase